jgi:hypothetical protein
MRQKKMTMEDVVSAMISPYQTQLDWELAPREQVGSLALMLAVALDQLAKRPIQGIAEP